MMGHEEWYHKVHIVGGGSINKKGALFILPWMLLLVGCGVAAPADNKAGLVPMEESHLQEEQEAAVNSLPEEDEPKKLLREMDYLGCVPETISLQFAAVEAAALPGFFQYGCVWIDDDTLIGLHAGEDSATIMRYEHGLRRVTTVYDLELAIRNILDVWAVDRGVLVDSNTGHYLFDGYGQLQEALVYEENGIVPDGHYPYQIAISDDFLFSPIWSRSGILLKTDK